MRDVDVVDEDDDDDDDEEVKKYRRRDRRRRRRRLSKRRRARGNGVDDGTNDARWTRTTTTRGDGGETRGEQTADNDR
jgi:hypothetical protein